MNMEDFGLSVKFVAKQLKTTELNVLMHIKRGLLSGLEMSGEWYVSEASLSTFLATGKHDTSEVVCSTSHCSHGCSSCQ